MNFPSLIAFSQIWKGDFLGANPKLWSVWEEPEVSFCWMWNVSLEIPEKWNFLSFRSDFPSNYQQKTPQKMRIFNPYPKISQNIQQGMGAGIPEVFKSMDLGIWDFLYVIHIQRVYTMYRKVCIVYKGGLGIKLCTNKSWCVLGKMGRSENGAGREGLGWISWTLSFENPPGKMTNITFLRGKNPIFPWKKWQIITSQRENNPSFPWVIITFLRGKKSPFLPGK